MTNNIISNLELHQTLDYLNTLCFKRHIYVDAVSEQVDGYKGARPA